MGNEESPLQQLQPSHPPSARPSRFPLNSETGDSHLDAGAPGDFASRFEAAFDHSPVGMAYLDLHGRFIRVNRKFSQLLGYSSDELLRLTLMDVGEPGAVVKDLTGLQELLNGSREIHTREKRCVRKDGSHLWAHVNVSLLRGADSAADCFVVVLQDISSRKQSEEDLARTNELLTISQIAGGTGSFEWLVPDNSLTWSENHIKMFGLWPSAFDGTFECWRKCVHPEDLPKVESQLQAAFAEKREEWLVEYRIHRADTAELRWVTARGRTTYDSRGKPLIMVGVTIDTTDRKHVEEELERSREDLEKRVHARTTELLEKTLEMSEQARQLDQANESLRQLSARILHLQDEERRRIASHLHDSTGGWITALAMNLSVVQTEGKKLSPKAKTIIADSLEMIREMSNDLRTVSHLLHPPLLDEMGLQSALRWFVEEFSKRSNIPVELELDAHLGRLTRECETAIFRIVQEALTNVHRHSASPRASICITRGKKEVRLEVRDWGKGMPSMLHGMPERPGVGSQGMRERVRQLGGVFEIRSGSEGTSVIAIFPEDSVCLPANTHPRP